MTLGVRNGKTTRQRVATAVRPFEAVARRPILVGVLLTVALLAMLAVDSLPSGAKTVPVARTPTATTASGTTPALSTPAVSPVTITVPAGKTPPAPAPPVNVAPGVTPRPGPTPAPSTPAAPGTVAPAVSAASAPTSAPLPSGRALATRHNRAPTSAATTQERLRSVVVHLSQCVSKLGAGSQRMLLLRAGIGTAGPASRRAVARTLKIRVGRERRWEHAALIKLRTEARRRRCGSTPAWVHVPPADRLVLVDAVLSNPAQPAKVASRSPLVLLASQAWGKFMWTPAHQR